MGLFAKRRESGQAAVEAALTMPMVVFVFLGTLQLFMLLQAKLMAQYAVFQANRVGSVMNGRCDAMTHAALLALTPTVKPFMGPYYVGTDGQKLGRAFREIQNNDYSNFSLHNGPKWGAAEAVVWIVREHPRFPGDDPFQAQQNFDVLLTAGQTPTRLELRMIYWAPLLIPFADWVFSRMALATLGLKSYSQLNPLVTGQKNHATVLSTKPLQNEIANEYLLRYSLKHYVFPIEVTSTMRMMSPVWFKDFAQFNCAPTPNSL